jgi:quercetin dioxygenase-like cupin family protein
MAGTTERNAWFSAMGVSHEFPEALRTSGPDDSAVTAVTCREQIPPLVGDNGLFRVYPLFPSDGNVPFEMFAVEMERGAFSFSDPHNRGTVEYVHVFEGRITVKTGDEEYYLSSGDSLRHRADRPHSFHNSGEETATLCIVAYYPESRG